ncbi:MAG: T9SS type A sorting domain-containing protein [Bacteroidota bacterium]
MKIGFIATLLLGSASLMAQNISIKVERNQKVSLAKEINFSDPALEDWEANVLTLQEQPKPASDYGNKKEQLNELRKQKQLQKNPYLKNASRGANPAAPIMLNNFTANNSNGTPNDNHIAISNGGKIVSVVNTNLRIYNEAGTQLQFKSLSSFANSLGFLQSISDPRVLYDPIDDRFTLLFFNGSTSAVSTIIVAFSKTNDPAGAWNFYTLKGNYMNDTTWSDYPIVTIGESDLFMTFNHLKDGEDWKTGFRYSAIWQIDKTRGYAGDTLQFNYWHNIEHDSKPIWSVCPVQGGLQPSGPETYFLSVRPGDLGNDTLFLHTISDSYQSGNAQFSTKVLKTPLSYGLPPNGLQKDGQYLATNDARVLCAMIENDRIQYVQNCIDTQYFTAGIYLGDIDNPSSANPILSGQIISNDTIDFGYPSIAYIGNNQFDNRSIITCSYSSPDTFPGTVAFYRDATGTISEMLIVKTGEDLVDVLGDTVERWGDYTGIQRKYNEPNTAWLAGSYVSPAQSYRTWIAKVVNSDSAIVSSVDKIYQEIITTVFPNPSSEKFSIQFELAKDNYSRFAIYDLNGRLVRTLLEDHFKAGTNIFSFNTQHLSSGTYFLKISDRENLLKTEKIIVSH